MSSTKGPQTHTGTIRPLPAAPDGRLNAPSAARNLEPILEVLRKYMPARGTAVELASGTGQHIASFAAAFPEVQWTPTDVDEERMASIEAWRQAGDYANLDPPLFLNAGDGVWPFGSQTVDATITVNLLHLVPQHVASSLFSGIGRALKPGGRAFIYGPFTRQGQFVSDGDRRFHTSLVNMDPAIGYKDQDWVSAGLLHAGVPVREWFGMPANNLMLVAEKPQTA